MKKKILFVIAIGYLFLTIKTSAQQAITYNNIPKTNINLIFTASQQITKNSATIKDLPVILPSPSIIKNNKNKHHINLDFDYQSSNTNNKKNKGSTGVVNKIDNIATLLPSDKSKYNNLDGNDDFTNENTNNLNNAYVNIKPIELIQENEQQQNTEDAVSEGFIHKSYRVHQNRLKYCTFKAYPSINNYILTLNCQFPIDNALFNIEIYNMLGEKVYTHQQQTNNLLYHKISVANWGKGTYLIQLQFQNQTLTQKIIVP